MQIHRPLNYISDGVDKRDFKLNRRLFRKLTGRKRSKILKRLPKEFDHTPNMTPVKDQGTLGSCVAFSTAALKEWQEWQEYLKESPDCDNKFSDLSEQWIYHKCKELDDIPSEGTTIRTALKVLKNYGVPPERYWTYNPHKKGEPEEEADKIAKYTRIGDFFRIKNLKELKIALLHTPVPMGVVVQPNFYTANNGVISVPSVDKRKGGHAICAVGFDDDKQLIKFKNSWSKNWGDKGYGYITYNYFKRYCMAAWAVKDIHVDINSIM